MLKQDPILVSGVIVLGLAIPSLLGALADRRPPRVATIAVLVGGGLVLLALSQTPGGYSWREIPEAFVRVIAHYTR